jgi:hypothetical protein
MTSSKLLLLHIENQLENSEPLATCPTSLCLRLQSTGQTDDRLTKNNKGCTRRRAAQAKR